jgi:hypothetical protein
MTKPYYHVILLSTSVMYHCISYLAMYIWECLHHKIINFPSVLVTKEAQKASHQICRTMKVIIGMQLTLNFRSFLNEFKSVFWTVLLDNVTSMIAHSNKNQAHRPLFPARLTYMHGPSPILLCKIYRLNYYQKLSHPMPHFPPNTVHNLYNFHHHARIFKG